MSYSKEDVKNNITSDDIFTLLESFNAEPRDCGDHIEAITVCHSGDSSKLWYFYNTNLFVCFTHCSSFDVIELVQKVKGLEFNAAIYFLVSFFNLEWKIDEADDKDYSIEDWKIFDRNKQLEEISKEDKTYHAVHLNEFDDSVIQYYPQPKIYQWEKENISKDICDYMNIRYDPLYGCILIPHYDEDGICVGIRQRTLVKENEKYGKYRPWRHSGQLYNHALAFNLYGLLQAKDNIGNLKVAIVAESEKAVLQYLSYFGLANDICVAVCGSSLSQYQFETLIKHGAEEIVIAFDKDYQSLDDTENFDNFVEKMRRINNKFSASCNLSFIVDTMNLLGYKESPFDKGREIFLELFKNRKYMESVVS
jgi:hypothetical protein